MDRRSLLAAGLGLVAAPALLPNLAQAQVQALPLKDRQLVEQAAAYLQNLKQAKGRFTQTSSRGAASSGTLYLNRPGKARFEYDPPAQMLIVSDGRNVSIYDRRLKTFERAPLGFTPLGIFLSRRIRLDDDVKVVRLTRSVGGFAVTVADARGQADGRLVLEFSEDPIALTGWTVIDGQGVQTRIRISGLSVVNGFDPALFVLADPRPANKG
jgi:outer membrane lipoprotein-sorting protein